MRSFGAAQGAAPKDDRLRGGGPKSFTTEDTESTEEES
jgi:hypothetical protein